MAELASRQPLHIVWIDAVVGEHKGQGCSQEVVLLNGVMGGGATYEL